MQAWKVIKKIRMDMSDYVLHCAGSQHFTRGKKDSYYNPFDTLKQILEDGFFRATFGEIETWPHFNKKLTVKGTNPAVCFTEQPLQFFIQSIRANGRYTRVIAR